MTHPFTPTPITRDADHNYYYKGTKYPGVTGILKILDKSGPLMNWAARNAAEAAIAQLPNLASMLETSGPEGVVKFLTSRSNWKRDEAAQLGSNIHEYADAYIRGTLTDDQFYAKGGGHAVRYAEWWKAAGWTSRISEGMLVNPEWGYGGTMDLLAYDRDGKTVLADIKTGAKGVYREAILQLTAYGAATLVQKDDQLFTMPEVHRYVLLHVTEGEPVREIEINVGALELAAWGACLDIHQWLQTVKKGAL